MADERAARSVAPYRGTGPPSLKRHRLTTLRGCASVYDKNRGLMALHFHVDPEDGARVILMVGKLNSFFLVRSQLVGRHLPVWCLQSRSNLLRIGTYTLLFFHST